MASIFKPPYISSAQLASLLVEDGQLVFNTDDKQFYTGNGTLGGRNIASTIPVPTKTSDLTNDSGFIVGETDGDGTKFLSNDGTYKTIEVSSDSSSNTQSTPNLLPVVSFSWATQHFTLSNVRVTKDDGIIAINGLPENETIYFYPLIIQGTVDKVKTYELWLRCSNPTSSSNVAEGEVITYANSLVVQNGLTVVDNDNFPQTIHSATWNSTNPPKTYRYYVFIIRCMPVYSSEKDEDGAYIPVYDQFINYSHYFDSDKYVVANRQSYLGS